MTMTTTTTTTHDRARSRGRRRGSLRTLASLGALLAASLSLWAAGPASAHDQLVESSPSEGETLTAAPSELLLRFSAEILDVGSEVQLLDAGGTVVPTDPLALDGTDVTVPIPEPLGDGDYSIEWRVVSSDGHPISGTIAFSVAAAESRPSADPSTPATAEATSDVGAVAPEPSGTAATAVPADDGGVPSFVWALLVVAGAAAVAVTLVVRRARARAGVDTAGLDESESRPADREGDDRA